MFMNNNKPEPICSHSSHSSLYIFGSVAQFAKSDMLSSVIPLAGGY
jgi:hypothetical protein